MQPDQNNPYAYPFFKMPYPPQFISYPQPQYPPYYCQFPYMIPRQTFMPPIIPQEQIKPSVDPIVISDDEEPVQQQKKQVKLLDLDQLEVQKLVFDYETSESLQLPKRQATRTARYDFYDSPRPRKKNIKLRKEQPRKESQIQTRNIKPVRIGTQFQQNCPEFSQIKTRLIRIYQKEGIQSGNEDKQQFQSENKFEQLFSLLKNTYPECNDEDVARVLNIAGKDYQRAFQLVQESDLLVQYYFETYFSKKELSDEESTYKK